MSTRGSRIPERNPISATTSGLGPLRGINSGKLSSTPEVTEDEGKSVVEADIPEIAGEFDLELILDPKRELKPELMRELIRLAKLGELERLPWLLDLPERLLLDFPNNFGIEKLGEYGEDGSD